MIWGIVLLGLYWDFFKSHWTPWLRNLGDNQRSCWEIPQFSVENPPFLRLKRLSFAISPQDLYNLTEFTYLLPVRCWICLNIHWTHLFFCPKERHVKRGKSWSSIRHALFVSLVSFVVWVVFSLAGVRGLNVLIWRGVWIFWRFSKRYSCKITIYSTDQSSFYVLKHHKSRADIIPLVVG